jgi:CRP/FNR family transcriptional regulator, cyclic AMP receptor protein
MQEATRLSKVGPVKVDPYLDTLLEGIVTGKRLVQLQKNTNIFSQGDSADAIFFVQMGRVKVTIVSSHGKEAVLGIVGRREFFGEGCLVGQTVRIHSVATMESSTIFRVEKRAMLHALHRQPDFSEKFTAALLIRNLALEADLCDQLFNHSEKRLARVLLKLSRFGSQANLPGLQIPKMTHETLAEMVGSTRSRVTFFMNKFKRLGLIEYTGAGVITVRDELLMDIVLHD